MSEAVNSPQMMVYLINLDRRTDRLGGVTRQLDDLNMSYVRFSAIDGLDPNAALTKFDRYLYTLNQKKAPVRGEEACAASHREVWRRFLNSEHQYALILEDDVILDVRLPAVLKRLAALDLDFINLSSTAPYRASAQNFSEVLKLSILQRPYFFHFRLRRTWRKLEWRKSWRIFQLHPVGNEFVCECDPAPALGSGYIISRKAALALLAATQHIYYPIDLAWRYASGMLRQGFFSEPLVTQVDQGSDIQGRYNQAPLPLLLRILRPFRKSRRMSRRLDVLKLYGIFRH